MGHLPQTPFLYLIHLIQDIFLGHPSFPLALTRHLERERVKKKIAPSSPETSPFPFLSALVCPHVCVCLCVSVRPTCFEPEDDRVRDVLVSSRWILSLVFLTLILQQDQSVLRSRGDTSIDNLRQGPLEQCSLEKWPDAQAGWILL